MSCNKKNVFVTETSDDLKMFGHVIMLIDVNISNLMIQFSSGFE